MIISKGKLQLESPKFSRSCAPDRLQPDNFLLQDLHTRSHAHHRYKRTFATSVFPKWPTRYFGENRESKGIIQHRTTELPLAAVRAVLLIKIRANWIWWQGDFPMFSMNCCELNLVCRRRSAAFRWLTVRPLSNGRSTGGPRIAVWLNDFRWKSDTDPQDRLVFAQSCRTTDQCPEWH